MMKYLVLTPYRALTGEKFLLMAYSKNKFMLAALEEAQRAFKTDEIPVGCIITRKNEIIATAHNMRESYKNALCHAELLAISQACNYKGDWRLEDCDIYVTLEPCIMCAGAILNARIRRLYFGSYDERFGGVKFIENKNNSIEVYGGICEEECNEILKDFFQKMRKER